MAKNVSLVLGGAFPEQEDKGAAYAGSKGFTVQLNVEPTEGFWINCTEDMTLE